MRHSAISKELFSKNRMRFCDELASGDISLFVAAEKMPRNGDQYYPFRQQSDFFYLTGVEQESCTLLLFPTCPNLAYREILFIEPWDPVKATWEGHMLTKQEASEISGIKNIYTTDQFEAVLHECMTYAKNVYLNNNEYVKFNPSNESVQLRFAKKLKEKYPLHEYCRAAPILESLRTHKLIEEIDLIKKACEITEKAFERVLKTVRPNMYEFEIEAEISHEFTVNRANGHGYHPIIGSGQNACVLHYNDNNSMMEDGDLLLMDFGAEYANYTADLSRTIPVNGKFNPRQRACYEAVLSVFKAAKPLYVAGNTIEKINETVWALMEQEMIGLGLFSEEDLKKQSPNAPLFRKYLMHGIAHHIGLDVHDVGSKYTPLKPGMILTCEPGLYIREEKIGIRIENDILITEEGPVDLMANIPVEADEIEQRMLNSKVVDLSKEI
ncbi:MAG: aminopeptidase P N-terminal domain-containing protein [Bacteroidales bacterium]|nr:aminopeptidase P N-terminal domain-containing protein [Bacteroidales bacterium]